MDKTDQSTDNLVQQFHDPTLPIEKKVAIVGIGCRFPKDIKNVSDFWRVVSAGEDCMIPHPPDRVDPSFIYPGERLPGKIYALRGGYLAQGAHEFDREFFQMSPDEASHMDPQQRLLLEVSWEALEDYGIDVSSLRKSNTGVYVGVMNKEYIFQLSLPMDAMGQYSASGNNSNMLSNRISYQFDLQGPSFTIDTACSSSMYAIHLACEAIRNNDCSLALAGGVNMLLTASPTVQLCQARMLSPDGRCKSFDKSADGYARGEGAGVLILKPLRQALLDGDKIYAVVRGGALNNDGKTKGITSPNPYSQESLLRSAYEAANVTPQDVPYVEAHGTGTQAGDVAESSSLGSVMGVGRRKHQPPLIVGSVKSNFGHTEGAAGVAGVIKACLVLKKKQIPKLVHFRERNEKVDWNKCPITFPTELMDWPKGGKVIAGCNGFGFGGANAHVVLEAAPAVERTSVEQHDNTFPTILFLSADSKTAMENRVSDWVDFLESPNMRNNVSHFRNVVQTAAVRAHHHQCRLAVYCESLDATIRLLEERQKNESKGNPMMIEGRVLKMPNEQIQKLVFVFSGMGTQWWAMGRQLMDTDQTFRRSIEEIDEMLKGFGATWSLLHLLTEEMDKERINNTEIAQPAICAVQISLAAVYRKLGVYPKVVIGHSVGEVAAACVGGYLSVADAMKLIYVRGKALQRTAGKGKMAAILAPASVVKDKLNILHCISKVNIACANGPSQTVISGDGDAVEECVKSFKSDGVRCVVLKVQNAFHSYQQEDIREYFLENTQFLSCPKFRSGDSDAPAQIPMISTVSGHSLNAKTLHTNVYWWQNIRQTVEFAGSLNTLFARGCNVFLEIGPHPSLASVIKSSMTAFRDNNTNTSFHESHAVISSLRRPPDTSAPAADKVNILMSIAKLHVQGFPLHLESLFSVKSFDLATLPNYPWQHKVYNTLPDLAKKFIVSPRENHPLLGKQVKVLPISPNSSNDKIWKSKYNRTDVPWLHHHKIQNVVVLPGAAFIDMMLTVARTSDPDASMVVIENVNFHKFHYSPDSRGSLYTTLGRISNDESKYQVAVRTYDKNRDSLTLNATCQFKATGARGQTCLEEYLDVDAIKRGLPNQYPVDRLYKQLANGGVEIGELFGSVTSANLSDDREEILFTSSLPEPLENESDLYIFHPALLDSVFQLFAAFSLTKEDGGRGGVEVPKSVGYLGVRGRAPPMIAIHARKIRDGADVSVTVRIADLLTGRIVANVENVQLANIGAKEEPSLTVWQKNWARLAVPKKDQGAIDTTTGMQDQSNADVCYIVPDKTGMSDALVIDLVKDSVFSSDSIHVTDISHGELQLPTDEDSVNENVIVLNMLDDCAKISLNEMTKDEFIQSQSQQMVELIQNVIKPFQKRQTSRIWIVTKGAMLASPDDRTLNPLMSKAHALVLTGVNETPGLYVSAIDLPHDLPLSECSRWLSQYMRHPIISENCVALRPLQERSGTNELEYSVSALRLDTKRSADLVYVNPCDEWKVDMQEITRNVDSHPVKPWNHTLDLSEGSESRVIKIKLDAYVQQSYKDPKEPETSKLGYFFTGSITKQDMSNDESLTPKGNASVIGYNHSHVVTSTIYSEVSDLIDLPQDAVSPAHVLGAVKHCLPLYLAIEKMKTFSQNGEILSLMIASCNVGVHLEFATRLAESRNMNITLLVESMEQKKQLSDQGKCIKVVSKDSMDLEIKSSSVDAVVFDPEFTMEGKYVDSLLDKISVFGTIFLTANVPFRREKCDPKQIHVIPLDTEFMLSHENQFLTSSSIRSLLHLISDHGDSLSIIGDAVAVNKATPAELLGKGVVESVPTIEIPFDFSNFARKFTVDPNATYLVVGGTKGIGFEIVQWLVSLGANMVYVSGRNAPLHEICTKIDQAKAIKFIKCDVADKASVTDMLTYVQDHSEYPLQGIFHCAAVFADQLLENATKEKWDEILLPKAYGALLLHCLTQKLDMTLKHFVVLSSIIECLGNEGQGNYCAANAFITSLCEFRRLQGLPATVIAPSAITEVGYAARNKYNSIFDFQGIMSVSPEQVLEGISWALLTDTTFCGLSGEFDRMRYVQHKSLFSLKQKTHYHYSVLRGEISESDLSKAFSMGQDNPLSNGLSPEDGQALVTAELVGFVKERLGVTDEISTSLSFSNYGLDSSMSFELSNLLKTKFGATVSSVELLNDTMNIADIVPLIYKRSTSQNGYVDVKVQRDISLQETAWFEEPREVKNARSVLLCFPYTGKGTTMFVDWSEQCKNIGVKLLVAQLPGWEGRPNEKPSRDIEEIVREFCACLLPRIKGQQVAVIGCGVGSLLAFEIIRRLQAGSEVSVFQFHAIAGCPPSVPFKSIMDNLQEESNGTVLENRDLRQALPTRNALLNAHASREVYQTYNYVSAPQLRCNVTVFSGQNDAILTPKILDGWKRDVHPDYKFKNLKMKTDHKLLRNEASNKGIFAEVYKSLGGPIKKALTKSNSGGYRKQRSIEYDEDVKKGYLHVN